MDKQATNERLLGRNIAADFFPFAAWQVFEEGVRGIDPEIGEPHRHDHGEEDEGEEDRDRVGDVLLVRIRDLHRDHIDPQSGPESRRRLNKSNEKERQLRMDAGDAEERRGEKLTVFASRSAWACALPFSSLKNRSSMT